MKRISILVAVAAPLLVIPSGALAGDAKVLPGAMCQRVAGHPIVNYVGGSYAANNLGAEGQQVNCPIIRESTASVLGEVKVRAGSQFATSGVRCRVVSHTSDGASLDKTEEQTNLTGGFKELRFVIDGLDHGSSGTFSVNCSMGSRDEIRSVRYSED